MFDDFQFLVCLHLFDRLIAIFFVDDLQFIFDDFQFLIDDLHFLVEDVHLFVRCIEFLVYGLYF